MVPDNRSDPSGNAGGPERSIPAEVWRDAVDGLPDGLCLLRPIADEQGRVVDFAYAYINPAGVRRTQVSAESLRMHSMLRLFPRFAHTRTFSSLVRVVETGEPLVAAGQTYLDTFGGVETARVFDLRAAMAGDYLRLMWRDVKEERRAQEQLRDAITIVQASPLPILTKTLDGVITSWNPAAERQYGYPAAEAIGRSVTILEPPERAGEVTRLTARVAAGERINVDTVRMAKSGARIEVALTLAPIRDDDGRVVGGVAAMIDITARHQAEDEVLRLSNERRDEAVSASEAKSRFLATMSHEVRSPLHGIIGLTDLLLDSKLSAGQRHHAEAVHAATKNLLFLVNDVLDISRIEAGRIELKNSEFALVDVVEQVLDVVGGAASPKGLGVGSYLHPDLPSTVVGDPIRLGQILFNLLGNAIKFTDEGGVAVFVRPDGDDPGSGLVRFDVVDTGGGISQDDIARIFDEFTQAEDAPAGRGEGGTGLGLAISKQLSELMGGQIGVDSEVGSGTTFWFTAALPPVTAGQRDRTFPERRAIMVEPNDQIAATLGRYHGDWGFQVQRTDDLEQAREALRTSIGGVDAVILAAGVDQPAATELARDLAPAPVIMLAAERPDESESAATAPLHVLPVPVHRDLLRCLVTAAPGWPDEAPPPAVVPEPSDARPTLASTVLVVDDNEINRMIATGMLRKYGQQPDVADNGADGVRMALEGHYQLILMDAFMPGMDGYQATEELRRREGSDRHTPVVAMTAAVGPEDRERCLQAGMDDFVAKPFTQEDVAHVVEQWIRVPR